MGSGNKLQRQEKRSLELRREEGKGDVSERGKEGGGREKTGHTTKRERALGPLSYELLRAGI